MLIHTEIILPSCLKFDIPLRHKKVRPQKGFHDQILNEQQSSPHQMPAVRLKNINTNIFALVLSLNLKSHSLVV